VLGIGSFGLAGDGGTRGSDGSNVPPPDVGPDATLCFGSFEHLCFTTPPTGDVALSGAIDTATDARCVTMTGAGGELCVIGGSQIEVTGTVAVSGARPLVLIATTSLTVSGTLDASSVVGGAVGAGANSAACTAATAPVSAKGGGGAGGSFGNSGGNGGKAQGAGGVSGASQTATFVRGGCAGNTGSCPTIGNTGGPGGVGGPGGGALYLIAGNQLAISGAVFASGAGGSLGGTYCGGGGGGTGGLIALEAPTIAAGSSPIAANGGGGAGATGASGASPGANGTTTTPHSAASGGTAGAPYGAAGGAGGYDAQAGAAGGAGTLGGGGGGGGVGFVWIHGAITGTPQISPAPTIAL
jgi:hypothetical protein